MTTLVTTQGWRFRRPSVIPGFGLTLGFTLAYLSLIVLVPLAGVAWRTTELGWAEFRAVAADERTLAALRISFGASLVARTASVRPRASSRRNAARVSGRKSASVAQAAGS